jgi:peptidoglycan/LPS O-acetylase OafA/YrhL
MDSITPPANDLSSKKIASTQIHELAGIELLRFLSAFAILVWHYQHFFFVGKFDDALLSKFGHRCLSTRSFKKTRDLA